MSVISKKGISSPAIPAEIASLSCSVRISLIIKRILPPPYKNDAKPSDNTLIADEEKKPSIKSNCVELHKQSEKKPIGSQSVRDLNRLWGGQDISLYRVHAV